MKGDKNNSKLLPHQFNPLIIGVGYVTENCVID
jgi:hypothetical protein